jgi:hypothetical protein
MLCLNFISKLPTLTEARPDGRDRKNTGKTPGKPGMLSGLNRHAMNALYCIGGQ